MRLEGKKLFFKTLDIFLEEPSRDEIVELQKKYSRVSVLTHQPLAVSEGFRLRQKLTPNIYLTDSTEEIFRRFRDTVKNEIHRTERLPGFEVRLPDANFKDVYGLYQRFELAQGRWPQPKNLMSKFLAASAYYGNRLISCILFFQSVDKIRIRSIFSARLSAKEMEDKELYKIVGFASKRLMFEICKYGKEHGAKLVDLASINLTDPAKKSIADFKNSFGGKIENEYQYIWSDWFFRFFEKIAGWKSALNAKLRR